jgi:hypothetical protein
LGLGGKAETHAEKKYKKPHRRDAEFAENAEDDMFEISVFEGCSLWVLRRLCGEIPNFPHAKTSPPSRGC